MEGHGTSTSQLSMFEDSMLVIHQLSKTKEMLNSNHPPILQWIILLSRQFEQLEFFHV